MERVFEQEILVPYRKALKEIHKELGRMVLSQAFRELMLRCDTPADLFTYYTEWKNRYLRHTDFMFFNAVMFDRLLSESDDKLRCVFVGERHANTLAVLFKALPQWHLRKQNFLNKKESPLGVEVMSSPGFVHELGGVVRDFVKPLVLNECAVCTATEKLKCCARCSYVKYCSVACQKKAWATHKQVCRPVKVLL